MLTINFYGCFIFFSPITVRVGNSAMGTRTVKVGRLFSRAMNDASAERASEVIIRMPR